jgi:signal peptidase II
MIVVLLALDLGTKKWAQNHLKNTHGIEVIGGFWRFDYVENQNISFSIGSSLPEKVKQPIIIGVNILALVFLTIFIIQADKTFVLFLSAALILAGALGNLIDRIMNGFVVDFIHWFYRGFDWPVFNLADAYVSVGMILLITEFVLKAQQEKKAASQTKNS